MNPILTALQRAVQTRELVAIYPYEDDLGGMLVWRILAIEGELITAEDFDAHGHLDEVVTEPLSSIVAVELASDYLRRMEILIQSPDDSEGRTIETPSLIPAALRSAAATGEVVAIFSRGCEETFVVIDSVEGDYFVSREVLKDDGTDLPGTMIQLISTVEKVIFDQFDLRVVTKMRGASKDAPLT